MKWLGVIQRKFLQRNIFHKQLNSNFFSSSFVFSTNKRNSENECLSSNSEKNTNTANSSKTCAKSDDQRYYEWRLSQITQNDKFGKAFYPHKFPVSITLPEYHKKYSFLKNEESLQEMEYVSGRVHSIRTASKKLCFLDLKDDNTKLQIKAQLNCYGMKEDYNADLKNIHRGDIVGVEGFPVRTKSGELSINARKLQILAPCLRLLPATDRPTQFKDQQTRYRKRYLDLILNNETKNNFMIRSKIISYLRNFLDNLGFIEVETAVMNHTTGGAIAKPFSTHHNSLNLDLVFRISPELALKMLVVGGFNRVYEIGKQFRNEGIDLTHNPEFTSCEFYMAYTDYNDMMEITQNLLSQMVENLFNVNKILYKCNENEEFEIDFTPPYKKIDLYPELERILNVKLPNPSDLHTYESECILKSICDKNNIVCEEPVSSSSLLNKLIETFIEPMCINPTFLINHPQIISPLAKHHRTIDGLTERFELFIAKKEICNAYTELNNPIDQRERFVQQANDKKLGAAKLKVLNEDFLSALEYGLPPTGGWGLGVDRLVMILTNSQNIKEVILFPLLKSVL